MRQVQASTNIPDLCIDRAHLVSKTDDTVIVHFTTFCHRTMFYKKRKELKNGVKVHLDLTEARLDLLIKASKYVKNLSNVDVLCIIDVDVLMYYYFRFIRLPNASKCSIVTFYFNDFIHELFFLFKNAS